MQIKSKNLFCLVLVVALSGCGLFGNKQDESKNLSAAQLYAEAKEELTNGGYENSVKLFERLESRFPFSPYAQQPQLEITYTYYKQCEQT